MKPKTQLQQKVCDLNFDIPELSKEKTTWIKENIFRHYRYSIKTGKRNTCLTCNHTWHGDDNNTCPKCNRRVYPLKHGRNHREKDMAVEILTYKGFQVVRYYWVERQIKYKVKPYWLISNVFSHWITDTGKDVVMAINRMGLNRWTFGEGWIFHSELEPKNPQEYYHRWNARKIPGRKVLPVIRRNGYKGSFHSLDVSYFFKTILTNQYAETLLKAGQYKAMIYFDEIDKERWSIIKICIRNNYIITDWSLYMDYIGFLKYFGKDISNSYYICPDNLKEEHDRYMKMKIKCEAEKRARELEDKIAKENEVYKAVKQNFLNLKFKAGDLQIVFLDDVKEFLLEGEELNHCLYASGYHEKDDSLIFSARKNDERIETIEFSLSKMQVVQCRGRLNNNTEYHNDIIDLLNENIKYIEKSYKDTVKKHITNL